MCKVNCLFIDYFLMMQPELLHLSMMILVKHVTMFQKYFLDKYT